MTKEKHQTRIIILENGEHCDSIVRKFEKGWIVRFKRGSSLLGKEVRVFTTLSGKEPLTWSKGKDHLSVYCEVRCDTAGSFEYSFSIDDSDEVAGRGYFLVMPQLKINHKVLPMDGITCQTYLTKLLGDLSSWKSRLQVAKESGYNMIHLTPIHELGISNSSYSISDHHALISEVYSKDKKVTFEDVALIVNEIEVEWHMLTVQDVVWNHAAKNAKWLQEHPESAYNCHNSPHLRPAYVLDRVYHHFGKEIGSGVWEDRGVPSVIDNIHQVNTIEYLLRAEVLPRCRLHEFFQVDVAVLCAEFETYIKHSGGPEQENIEEYISIKQDDQWRRFGSSIDFEMARKVFNRHRDDSSNEDERRAKCVASFRQHIEELNIKAGEYAWNIVTSGLNAVIGHVTYERVADHGPKKGKVCEENPLTTDYFLHNEPVTSWEEEEKLAYDSEKSKQLMAFNGWVMSSNPLANFALPDSQVYLRRELVCWGDSVKLNYGNAPEDSPFLWDYMKKYTQQCTRIFHGLRIDNAHGTPIHVAEHLLKAAREIRPDVYVFAELFTGSEEADNVFVNRLGISSLIREAQSAHDSHEQGRLVYRYGGDCVGAMMQKETRLAAASVAHGLFLDQSHDNPSPIITRSGRDILPTAAMLTMASCAVGSTRGYDELVRHHVHVVTETRPYSSWDHKEQVSIEKGIVEARCVLNKLHLWLAENGYSQVYVDQMNADIVGITRHNPVSHETVICVSHTAFSKHYSHDAFGLKHIPIGGILEKTLFEMTLVETASEWDTENDEVLVGLSNFRTNMRCNIDVEDGSVYRLHGGTSGYIELTAFPSGSAVAFKVKPSESATAAFDRIRSVVEEQDIAIIGELHKSLEELDLLGFNRLLFSSEAEDYAIIQKGGYDVPNFGKFVYCGLQGMIPVLDKIRENNDLGHPLCQNLRDGTWICDYIVQRLACFEELKKLSEVFEKILHPLADVPYYLRPSYFESIITFLYKKAREVLLSKMSPEFANATSLNRWLALSTVSFVGNVPGAGLAPLSPSVAPSTSRVSSLSAGLPHFSVGIWRNWGRDTFISLPGCLLLTGRFNDARNIILSYGGALRHGLIPNLLAEGIGARYNCRDATWFWLLSIVRYVDMAPNGDAILKDTVRRIYPEDDTKYGEEEREQPLIKTIYEALDRHFDGISYRERNAGSSIDEQMMDEGFNVTAGVDMNTGFVFGGNRWNCGTWMDKMGSSEKAGNKGEPATPRDGAAVELQALAYRVLISLALWAERGIISRNSVKADNGWTWSKWAQTIKNNFEEKFFVDDNCQHENVNRRNIVKDSVGSSLGFSDYQLRCNFLIALATAPELLKDDNAWKALDTAKVLLGPIGIKTLDPSDWAYNGFYDNENDGTDKKTAKGWNYHQGPEWLWVSAVYLSARLAVGERLGGSRLQEAIKEVQMRLGASYQHIIESSWRSLPELTNENGEYCHGSCRAQAWSVGCLLDACHKLGEISDKLSPK